MFETLESWSCRGNTHILKCEHAVTLRLPDCNPSCLHPQDRVKTTIPHKCPTCATISDEHHLLNEIAELRELCMTAEDMQADHDHVPSDTIDYICEREMMLEHEVSKEVWTLYRREGAEGIKRRQKEREVRTQRRRSTTESLKWEWRITAKKE